MDDTNDRRVFLLWRRRHVGLVRARSLVVEGARSQAATEMQREQDIKLQRRALWRDTAKKRHQQSSCVKTRHGSLVTLFELQGHGVWTKHRVERESWATVRIAGATRINDVGTPVGFGVKVYSGSPTPYFATSPGLKSHGQLGQCVVQYDG